MNVQEQPKEWSPEHWLTTKEMAQAYNRCDRLIRHWIKNGTLAAFGFSVIEFSPRRRFIRKPNV